MTIPSPATAGAGQDGPLRLLLAACGRRQAIEDLLASTAPVLAASLALPLRSLANPEAPDQSLAALHAAPADTGPGWLAPLPLDPGLPLPAACCWAEVLGSWRQPCLLLLRADELDTGRPAATAALLRQWRVPLLGLVQSGEPWTPQARRADGLPWLGWMPQRSDAQDAPPQEAEEAPEGQIDARLAPLLRRRLAALDLG